MPTDYQIRTFYSQVTYTTMVGDPRCGVITLDRAINQLGEYSPWLNLRWMWHNFTTGELWASTSVIPMTFLDIGAIVDPVLETLKCMEVGTGIARDLAYSEYLKKRDAVIEESQIPATSVAAIFIALNQAFADAVHPIA